jgi:tetratricopeptide (TPR) repeat protein
LSSDLFNFSRAITGNLTQTGRKGGSAMKAVCIVKASLLMVLLCVGSSWAQDWESASKQSVIKADWVKVTEAVQQWKQRDAAPVADWLLGYASLATGDYNQALESFSRLRTTAETQAVLNYATALTEQNSKNAVAQMLKGDALARAGKHEEALAALDEAVRLDARSALIYDVRGVVRVLAGKTEDAIADFEKAIELEPKFAEVYANLGLVQLAAGDTPGAVESLTQAIDLAPDFALAHNGRGIGYSIMEDWPAAEGDFASASKLSNQTPIVGNLNFLQRLKAEAGFRKERWVAKLDERGTTLIAQSVEHRVVGLGGDRVIDAFIVRPTQQTSTLAGARDVIKGIVTDLRVANGLPASWQPRIHIDAHGAFSSPVAQLDYAAQVAHQSGADSVILLDLSSWYSLPGAVMWRKSVDEGAKFLATTNATVNLETRHPPTFTGFSGGAEILPRLGELYEKGSLSKEVADNINFSNAVLTGYPFHDIRGGDVRIPDTVLQRISGNVCNLVTDRGNGSNRLQPNNKVANIRVRDVQDGAIRHSDWTHSIIRGRPNPVYELAGISLRGTTPATVQSIADERNTGRIPLYSVSAQQPITMAVSMASMTERGLRTGDRVLIGSLDSQRANVMRRTLGNWQTEVRAVTDPGRLQDIARQEGFTRVLLITPGSSDYVSEAVLTREQQRPFATLPDIRTFRETLSRSLQAISVFENMTGRKILSDKMKNALKLSGAVAEDLISSQHGHFNFLTSQSLEELGKVRLIVLQKKANLAGIDGVGDMVGSVSSMVGHRTVIPNLNEVTKFLDGLNKSVWAATGSVLSGGNPVEAVALSKAADLFTYTVRGRTAALFERKAMTQIHGPVINHYLTQLESARARGVLTPTFTEMMRPDEIRKIGIPDSKVDELDNLARWHNQVISNRSSNGSQPLLAVNSDYFRFSLPTRKEEPRRKSDIVFYDRPERWSGPPPQQPPPPPPAIENAGTVPPSSLPPPRLGIPTLPNYRLPSAALPSDKRGGVLMKTEVVKTEQADMSEWFGSAAGTQRVEVRQGSLFSPFLLFCASPVGKGNPN